MQFNLWQSRWKSGFISKEKLNHSGCWGIRNLCIHANVVLSYLIYVYSWNLLYLYGIMALCVHDLQIFWTTISTPQLWNCEIQMAKCPAVFATRNPLPIATVGFADSMIVWLPRGATCVKRLYLRTAARLLTIEGSLEALSRFWLEVIAHSTIYHHLPYKIRK